VRSVEPEDVADVDYRFTGLDISLGVGTEVDPVVDAIDLDGDLLVHPDRRVESATVATRLSDALPSILRDILNELDPRVTTLLLPFPTEPVGRGARWRITGPLPVLGAATVLDAQARLVRHRGALFDIVFDIALTTPDQGDGNALELEGLAHLVGDTRSLGPTLGTLDLAGTVDVAGTGTEPFPLQLSMTINGR
jgi:hypothetical protein